MAQKAQEPAEQLQAFKVSLGLLELLESWWTDVYLVGRTGLCLSCSAAAGDSLADGLSRKAQQGDQSRPPPPPPPPPLFFSFWDLTSHFQYCSFFHFHSHVATPRMLLCEPSYTGSTHA